jgi:hypothetical protein
MHMDLLKSKTIQNNLVLFNDLELIFSLPYFCPCWRWGILWSSAIKMMYIQYWLNKNNYDASFSIHLALIKYAFYIGKNTKGMD